MYRAANSLLRLALDGRLSLCFHPPGYNEQKGQTATVLVLLCRQKVAGSVATQSEG